MDKKSEKKEKKKHHHHHHHDKDKDTKDTTEQDRGGDGKVRPIKLSDYDMGETLGTGSFGRVKIAKDRKTGEYVAMKIMKKVEIIKSKQADHISNEIKILSMIDHPFVITFGGFTQDDRNLYLALELINGGELFTYLRGVGRFPVDQARLYIAQIVMIFDYLHNKNIIYRDLKPENILIHKSGYLKLTDFGFAKIVEGRTYTLCGTPEYLAPEIILNKGHGKPVDWWTCGILLYEMIAGIDPFSDDDPMMVYQKILKGKIKFPSGFDSNAKSLIKHLLDSDLTKRYGNLKNGVKDITGHRFFKNLEWDKLLKKELPPPYVPKVKSKDDISNFSAYPDSDNKPLPELVLLSKKRQKPEEEEKKEREPVVLMFESEKESNSRWKDICQAFHNENPDLNIIYRRFKDKLGHIVVVPENDDDIKFKDSFKYDDIEYKVKKCENDDLINFYKDHGKHYEDCVAMNKRTGKKGKKESKGKNKNKKEKKEKEKEKKEEEKKNFKENVTFKKEITLGDEKFTDSNLIKNKARKIITDTKDGEKLKENDQKFVLDLLKYHHNYESKSKDLDYITVGKPENYESSRCFIIVNKKNEKHDFSVKKCIDNLISKNQ